MRYLVAAKMHTEDSENFPKAPDARSEPGCSTGAIPLVKYCMITPARDEEQFITGTIESPWMANQTAVAQFAPSQQLAFQPNAEAVDGSVPSARRTPGLVAALQAPTLTLPRVRGSESAMAPFGNDLEPASRRLFPPLDEALMRLHDIVPGLTMSGTGAALFATFVGRANAEAALGAVRKIGYPAWVCRPVSAAP